MDGSNISEIKSVLVFTTDEVELNADALPIAAMKLKKLKKFMRQVQRIAPFPANTSQKSIRRWQTSKY
jgi:hypothetical protein